MPPLTTRLVAEAVGTALLVAAVVGSGIMAQRRSTDAGLQLLENTVATAGVLAALILALGPVSGAHFNPVVTLVDRLFGSGSARTTLAYAGAQTVGAIVGSIVANLMFDLDPVTWSTTDRSAGHLMFAEGVATFGLVLVVFGVVRSGRSSAAPYAVAGYIAGAYWFTSSTSFANPAVTIGRMFSDTFAGIEPASAPAFIGAQLMGAIAAYGLARLLYPAPRPS